MPTNGANLRHILRTTQDMRLLDMFDGALLPPEPPPPCRETHDFLVVNPWPELTPELSAETEPTRTSRGYRSHLP